MGIALFIIILVFIIVFVSAFLDNCSFWDSIVRGLFSVMVTSTIAIAMLILFRMISYTSYLDYKSFHRITVYQYIGDVEDYLGNNDITTIDSLTDTRGEGYQGALADKVNNLHRNIRRYNEWVISNEALSNNFFTMGYVQPPDDDMPLLKSEALTLVEIPRKKGDK